MITRWIALIGAAVALTQSGCDIETCKKGEQGCIGGPVKAGDTCSAGLESDGHGYCKESGSAGFPVVDGKCPDGHEEKSGACVPKEVENPDGGMPDGGMKDKCGGCKDGALCMTDSKECVNFCKIPEEIPGIGASPERILCGADTDGDDGTATDADTDPDGKDLTFEQICINRCLQECRWKEWFCGETACTKADCDTAAVKAKCDLDFAVADPNRVAKLAASCAAARGRACDSGDKCTNGKAPKCDDVQCSNTCGGDTSNDFDSWCDDGAYANSASNLCPFGTDCADCGPRGKQGPNDALSDLGWGELCGNPFMCRGFDSGRATCLLFPGPVEGIGRCVPNCTDTADICPDGLKCYKVGDEKYCGMMDSEFEAVCP